MEFMEIVGFDHSIIRPDKLQKAKTRLQMDVHCLAVHQNTNKPTLEYVGVKKSLAEKVIICHLSL